MLKQLAVIYAMTSARVNICNTVGLVSCYQAHMEKNIGKQLKEFYILAGSKTHYMLWIESA